MAAAAAIAEFGVKAMRHADVIGMMVAGESATTDNTSVHSIISRGSGRRPSAT